MLPVCTIQDPTPVSYDPGFLFFITKITLFFVVIPLATTIKALINIPKFTSSYKKTTESDTDYLLHY